MGSFEGVSRMWCCVVDVVVGGVVEGIEKLQVFPIRVLSISVNLEWSVRFRHPYMWQSVNSRTFEISQAVRL